MSAATVAAATPAKPRKAPEGLPITPQRGVKKPVEDIKSGVIAQRQYVLKTPAPGVRIFTGAIKDLKPGTKFLSFHKTAAGHPPCGEWEVVAVITNGKITQGTAPEKVTRFAVNVIG